MTYNYQAWTDDWPAGNYVYDDKTGSWKPIERVADKYDTRKQVKEERPLAWKAPLIAVLNSWGSVDTEFELLGATVFNCQDERDVEAAARYADAIVLTGGSDVNPARYGQSKHPETYGVDEKRDAIEFLAIAAARKNNIPVFGICRGHQLINVAFGGSLHQHIQDHKHVFNHWGGDHKVKLDPRSGLHGTIGQSCFSGVSYHHQAIDRLGDGLLPIAWAYDGTIEAIESAPGVQPYALGVQFHPEMDNSREASLIFAHVVDIASRRARRRHNVDTRYQKARVMAGYTATVSTSYSEDKPSPCWQEGDDHIIWCRDGKCEFEYADIGQPDGMSMDEYLEALRESAAEIADADEKKAQEEYEDPDRKAYAKFVEETWGGYPVQTVTSEYTGTKFGQARRRSPSGVFDEDIEYVDKQNGAFGACDETQCEQPPCKDTLACRPEDGDCLYRASREAAEGHVDDIAVVPFSSTRYLKSMRAGPEFNRRMKAGKRGSRR